MIYYAEKEGYSYYNLFSYRQWIDTNKLSDLYVKINSILLKEKAQKVGPIISATHNTMLRKQQKWIDFEILIPVDKQVESKDEFWMRDKFSLNHVLSVHVVDKNENMVNIINDLDGYIIKNHIIPKSPMYSILNKEDNGIVDACLVLEM